MMFLDCRSWVPGLLWSSLHLRGMLIRFFSGAGALSELIVSLLVPLGFELSLLLLVVIVSGSSWFLTALLYFSLFSNQSLHLNGL